MQYQSPCSVLPCFSWAPAMRSPWQEHPWQGHRRQSEAIRSVHVYTGCKELACQLLDWFGIHESYGQQLTFAIFGFQISCSYTTLVRTFFILAKFCVLPKKALSLVETAKSCFLRLQCVKTSRDGVLFSVPKIGINPNICKPHATCSVHFHLHFDLILLKHTEGIPADKQNGDEAQRKCNKAHFCVWLHFMDDDFSSPLVEGQLHHLSDYCVLGEVGLSKASMV